jgi:hypothetical protein
MPINKRDVPFPSCSVKPFNKVLNPSSWKDEKAKVFCGIEHCLGWTPANDDVSIRSKTQEIGFLGFLREDKLEPIQVIQVLMKVILQGLGNFPEEQN